MYGIATLVNSDSIPGAIALANSLRIYSTANLICMISDRDIDTSSLDTVFDRVIMVDILPNNATKWNILGLDMYKKILYLNPDSIALDQIDSIFMMSTPATVFDRYDNIRYTEDKKYMLENHTGTINPYLDPIHGMKIDKGLIPDNSYIQDLDILLIEPSKFAMDLFRMEDVPIIQFYHNHGYTWTNIDIQYNVSAYHLYDLFKGRIKIMRYSTNMKPWMETESEIRSTHIIHLEPYLEWVRMYKNLSSNRKGIRNLTDHLLSILTPILGPNSKKVMNKYLYLYKRVFTDKSSNPVSNYELLEAYGDKLLKGSYMWLLLDTPGIILPDQIDKITSYFQDNERLEQVCDYLDLSKFIDHDRSVSITGKMKSDIVEALIGAIGISWQKMYGKGDHAVYSFIKSIYTTIFTIDPINYISLYEHPKTRLKEIAERIGLLREKISDPIISTGKNQIMAIIKYDNIIIGTATVNTVGMNKRVAKATVEKKAYLNAVTTNSLELIAKSRR